MFKVFGALAGTILAAVALMMLYAKVNGNAKIDKYAGVLLDKAVKAEMIDDDMKTNITYFMVHGLAASPALIAAAVRAPHTPKGFVNFLAVSSFPLIWFFILSHDEGTKILVQSAMIFVFALVDNDYLRARIIAVFAICMITTVFKISDT